MKNFTDMQAISRYLLVDARLEAEKSPCLKKKVGAVLFNYKKGQVVGEGYGGALIPCNVCVRKELEFFQDGCWSIHAEMRAIFDYFNRFGYVNDLSDCIVVMTHKSCDQCCKLMTYFGISEVYYDIDYKADLRKWEPSLKCYKINGV
jgi:deoxycytidylate deaminase